MYVNSLNFKLTDKGTTKILNKQVKRHFCFFFINFVPLNALLIKKNIFFWTKCCRFHKNVVPLPLNDMIPWKNVKKHN